MWLAEGDEKKILFVFIEILGTFTTSFLRIDLKFTQTEGHMLRESYSSIQVFDITLFHVLILFSTIF